ncbi:MAG: DUF2029 domain-containing protein [Clostridia bacterium]|nr:DUF2029 domain-containing protein [Clostridia bacterium]
MFKIFKRQNDLKIDSEKAYYKHLFYIMMACFVFVFFLMAFMTHGTSFKGIFFKDVSDTFMDHYNSVVYNAVDPYENGVVYPPLATFTYGCLLKLIPGDTFNAIVSDPTILSQSRDIKVSQGFVFQFILFSVITFLGLMIVIYLCKKGSTYEKMAFSLLICMTTPVLFAIERGNNIIIPLFFSLIFVSCYDSENKIIREIALISLALAVAFKLYPIAFGVLLFRNKQYKELVRAGIYCIVFTVLPFFIFYNGFDSMRIFIERLTAYDGKKSSTVKIDGQLSFKGIFYYITGFLRLRFSNTELLSNIFRYIMTGLCIGFAFLTKSNWKAATLCACFICGFQGVCPQYLLVFFIVPVMMFLDQEKKKSYVNYICLIFLVLIIAPIVLPDPNTSVWSTYTSSKVSSLSILAVALIICADTTFDYIMKLIRHIKRKNRKSSVVTEDSASLPLIDGGLNND